MHAHEQTIEVHTCNHLQVHMYTDIPTDPYKHIQLRMYTTYTLCSLHTHLFKGCVVVMVPVSGSMANLLSSPGRERREYRTSPFTPVSSSTAFTYNGGTNDMCEHSTRKATDYRVVSLSFPRPPFSPATKQPS